MSKVVNLLVMDGIISTKNPKSLSFRSTKSRIDKAFKGKKVRAVGLIINSPGGSAAQSEIIANYIKYKSQKTNIPVISFVEDVAASGGYFIAVVAKEIYALASSSIVGSIGVLYSSFGLEDFISRYGIKRRLHTAGEHKVIMDMFSSPNDHDTQFLKHILEQTHEYFKNFVKSNRSNISLSEEELFSGKFWLANEAVKHGIIDGVITNYYDFFHKRFGKKVKINLIKSKKGILSSLFKTKLEINTQILDSLSEIISNKSELQFKN